jgi:hypothetical protein
MNKDAAFRFFQYRSDPLPAFVRPRRQHDVARRGGRQPRVLGGAAPRIFEGSGRFWQVHYATGSVAARWAAPRLDCSARTNFQPPTVQALVQKCSTNVPKKSSVFITCATY